MPGWLPLRKLRSWSLVLPGLACRSPPLSLSLPPSQDESQQGEFYLLVLPGSSSFCPEGKRQLYWPRITCDYWVAPWKKSYNKPRQCVTKHGYHFVKKGLFSQSYGFSSSHVRMWELDHDEGWVPKNWCFQTVVLEKILESPVDCKEIKPVNPKENQLWIFIGRTVAEGPILGLPDVKRQLIGKDPGVRTEWRQKEKELIEDKMVR